MPKPPTSAFCARSMTLGAVLMLSCILVGKLFIAPLFSDLSEPSEQQTLRLVQDSLTQHSIFDPSRKELLLAGAAAMVNALNDPYADYVSPEDVREFKEESTGMQIGIGILLNSDAEVVFPLPNSDAALKGISPGDSLLEIDGKNVSLAASSDITSSLRGRHGTTVKLKLQRHNGDIYSVEVMRQRVPTLTVTDERIIDKEHGIAHLTITSFASSTPDEITAALQRLDTAGMQALILDLRFNLGGQLNDAIAVVSHFLRGDLVCRLRPHSGEELLKYADLQLSSHPDLPLVVLVNELSASGSEVVVAALRDHQRATSMGMRTYGKGVFQKVLSFRNPNFAIKFTAGYYLTPDGEMIEGNIGESNFSGGLLPDIVLERQNEAQCSAIRAWSHRPRVPEKYQAIVNDLFPDFQRLAPPADNWVDSAAEFLIANSQKL
ncbi:MAG: PDZ domain-containing protein [Planctomycetes bacterium]|nr:PDZ domain-containing protein [Planctomycetota bacterium]